MLWKYIPEWVTSNWLGRRAKAAWVRLSRKLYDADPPQCAKCKAPMRLNRADRGPRGGANDSHASGPLAARCGMQQERAPPVPPPSPARAREPRAHLTSRFPTSPERGKRGRHSSLRRLRTPRGPKARSGRISCPIASCRPSCRSSRPPPWSRRLAIPWITSRRKPASARCLPSSERPARCSHSGTATLCRSTPTKSSSWGFASLVPEEAACRRAGATSLEDGIPGHIAGCGQR